MSRPQKNNAIYFSHDADMRNDLRIKALRRKYKHVGYSIYNMILEVLTDSDSFRYELSDINLEILAGDFDIETGELVEIINYLTSPLDLVQVHEKALSCSTLEKRFNYLLSKRKRERNVVIVDDNVSKSGLSSTITPKKEVIDVDNPHSIVYNSIVDNSIENIRAGAYARYDDLDKVQQELLSSDYWIEVTCKTLNTDVAKVKALLPEYIMEQKAKNKVNCVLNEYKSHFVNWARIQLEKKQAGKEYSYNEICELKARGVIRSIMEDVIKIDKNRYTLKNNKNEKKVAL